MSKTLDQILAERPEVQQTLERERAYMEAYMLIIKLMDEQCVSKAELARRLGRSRAYVTKLLNGSTNMTIRTIADVLFHLDRRLEISGSELAAAPIDSPKDTIKLCEATYAWAEAQQASSRWGDNAIQPRAKHDTSAKLRSLIAG